MFAHTARRRKAARCLVRILLCSYSPLIPPTHQHSQPQPPFLLLLVMPGRDKVTAQLEQYAASRAAADGVMTSSSGNPLDSITTSLTAGPRGPILLQVRMRPLCECFACCFRESGGWMTWKRGFDRGGEKRGVWLEQRGEQQLERDRHPSQSKC